MTTQSMAKRLSYVPSITVDIVIFAIENNEVTVLCIKRAHPPYAGQWALPGGFLFLEESAERAALRILSDKAGVRAAYLEQLYTFDTIGRDPRGRIISVTYYALGSYDAMVPKHGKATQMPTFFSVTKLPRLAFDHHDIIVYALGRLRAKLEYTNVIYSLLPRYFTLHQLHNVYEVVLGKKLDKRNFIKKFLSLGLLRPTKKILRGQRQRPARLYTFIARRPTELKKFF